MAKGVMEKMDMETGDLKLGVSKPSTNFIYGASIVSILLSLLTVRRSPSLANFFGLWAPTILGLGILMKENKLLDMQRRQLPSY